MGLTKRKEECLNRLFQPLLLKPKIYSNLISFVMQTEGRNMSTTGNKTVDAIGQIHFEGNIIPHMWYQTLRLDDGKPDTISMILLSEFIYWYRPTVVKDERSGAFMKMKKKFKEDLLQKSYKELSEQFGFSYKQIRGALERLEAKRVCRRVFRTVESPKGKLPNTMFIELFIPGIMEITFPQSKDVFTCRERPIYPEGKTSLPVGKDITEITTENTTKTTTESNNTRAKKCASEYSDQFLELWNMYPKKKDKKAANKAFKAAMKRADFETIKKGLANYVAEQKSLRTELTYYKHFSTFMNGDSYNDYQVLNAPQPKRRGQANTGSERQGLTYAELQERIKPELEQSGETPRQQENFFDDEDLPF